MAEIDVCMGGRVAEELSELVITTCWNIYGLTVIFLVYGPENVTSGASSDLKHATDTATRMVKVYISHTIFSMSTSLTMV
jgi:ATP-dependent metalloprotease